MKKFCGLNNCGATCYLSSVVQAVNHTASYRALVMDDRLRDENVIKKLVAGPPPLEKGAGHMYPLSALQVLLTQLRETIQPSLDTLSLCGAFGMTKKDMSTQEDANEFFKRLLDLLDAACREFGLEAAYQSACESVYTQGLRCGQCGHVSRTEQRHVDVLLPIMGDLFESLSQYFQPEEISGYVCGRCGRKSAASRALSLERQADVFAVTLQRFVFDFQQGNYRKDAAAVQCPVALDMQWCGKLSYEFVDAKARELLGRASLGDGERRKIFLELLRVYGQPWDFVCFAGGVFRWRREPENALVRQIVAGDGKFLQYCATHYSGGTVAAFEVESGYFLPLLDGKRLPVGLFLLQAVICHVGGLNSGHYYTLTLNLSKTLDRLQMVELNDEAVTIQANPAKILDYIAGKAQFGTSEDSTTQTRKLTGFGNTGYMYFYQRVDQLIALQHVEHKMPACVAAQIEAMNERQMEQQCRIDLQIVSNYGSENCFYLEKNDIPQYLYIRDADYRHTVLRFLEDYIATYNLLDIDLNKITVYKLCSSATVTQLKDMQLSRLTLLKPGDSLDTPLQVVLPGFAPKPTLFFEFPCAEPFDPASTYISITELSVSEEQKLQQCRREIVRLNQKVVDLAQRIYPNLVVPQGRWPAAVVKAAVARSRVGAMQDVGLLCSQLILFKQANGQFYEEVSGPDDVTMVPLSSGERLFCEFLPADRSLPAHLCPVIGARPGQGPVGCSLESVSAVLQFQRDLKSGFMAQLLGQNDKVLKQTAVRRQDTIEAGLDLDAQVGGSALGYTLQVGSVQRGQFSGAARLESARLTFAEAASLLAASSLRQTTTLSFKVEFNQSPMNHWFQFAVAMQNQLPDVFVLCQNQAELADGDTVQDLWERFLRTNAAQAQLADTQAPVEPTKNLRFFWIPQRAAFEKLHAQQFRVLLTGSAEIPHNRPLQRQQFTERFIIYVDYVSALEQTLAQFCPKAIPCHYASLKIFWEQYVEIARIPIAPRTTAAQFQAFVDQLSGGNGELFMIVNKRQVPVPPATEMAKVNPEYWVIK